MKDLRTKIFRASLIVFIGTLLYSITEFGKEVAIAAKFGTSYKADALFGALSIPMVFWGLLQSVSKLILVPVFTDVADSKKNTNTDFFANMFNLTLILGILTALIFFLFAPFFIKLSVPGLNKEFFPVSVKIQRELCIFLFILFPITFFILFLQAKKNFISPSFTPVFQNAILIIMILYTYKKFDVSAVSLGYGFGALIQVILLIISGYKTGFHISKKIDFKDENIVTIRKLLLLPIITFAIRGFNPVIDRAIASFLDQGSIAALSYSFRLSTGIRIIIAGSVFTVSLPYMTTLLGQGNISRVKTLLESSIKGILLVLIPLSTIILVLSTPLIEILFERGAFNHEDTLRTASALQYFILGLVPSALVFILSAPYLAMKKPKVPLLNNMSMFFLNGILTVIMGFLWKINGIGAASSLTFFISVIIQYYLLKRMLGEFLTAKTKKFIVKLIFASTLMGFTLYAVNFFLCPLFFGTGIHIRLLRFMLTTLSGIITFGVFLFIFKVNEVKSFFNGLKLKE